MTIEPAAGLLGCDAAFPVLHGPGGEDGSVQGLLEVAGHPATSAPTSRPPRSASTSSPSSGSSPRRGSPRWSSSMRRSARVRREPDGWREPACAWACPLWVKPARLGSSVGITKVESLDELATRGQARPPPRSEGDRRGHRPRRGGRVLGARPLRAHRLGPRRDRRPRRLVRLRGEVRGGRDGAASSRPGSASRRRAGPRARAAGLRALRLLGPRPLRLLRRRRGRCW